MEIPKALKDEIWDYCRLNDISNIEDFTLKLVKTGFTVEKFGATPATKTIEKEVEKIVEVIKEVPIEVIKEVIVEKVVEKEVYITDDEANKVLNEKISKLENDIIILKEQLETQVKIVFDISGEKNTLEKELDVLKEELKVEKNKNKKDIYGE
jgi:hypothetical protein